MVLLVRMGDIKEGASLKEKKDKFGFGSVVGMTRNLFWLDTRTIFLSFRSVRK